MTVPAGPDTTVGVVPIFGDATGTLNGLIKPERDLGDTTMRSHYGYECSSALGAFWPGGADLTVTEAVVQLKAGIDVSVWCTEDLEAGDVTTRFGTVYRQARRTQAKHALRMHPDGSITMMDHLDYIPDGHSSNLDIDSEMFLKSLGTQTPACVQTVLWFIQEQHNPPSHADLVKTFGVNPNTGTPSPFRARTLYAAVAWAQQDAWPRDAWNKFCNAGTTPRTLAHWVDQGWTVEEAVMFLNRDAAFDIAEQWRITGDTSPRAARLAGLGETPANEEPWLAVGFAPGESDQWRTHAQIRTPRFTPEAAWEWYQRKVMPNTVRDFKALPKTPEEAAQRLASRTANSVTRPRPKQRYAHEDLTLDTALAWVAAGMPSDLTLAWYRHLGDNLPVALDWARKVPVSEYTKILTWNEDHPETPIGPEQVYRLRRLGVPYRGELMGPLVAADVTYEEILRPLHMLPAGKRWLGIELRSVLEPHIREARALEVKAEIAAEEKRQADIITNDALIAAAEAAGTHLSPIPSPNSTTKQGTLRPTNYKVLLEAIDNDDWTTVVQRLRRPYWGELWKVYIDWLVTHPTPPRRKADATESVS